MTDLTVGKPWTVLWKFSLPMFVSVIFQQMYSIFDSIIAGKFAGEDALAAVGASYPITMIFMAFAVGSNVGCCVVISQFFGGKEFSKVKTASTTTIISCTVLATVLTIFGLAFSTPLMRMINTPDNIFRDGELYLKIYIAGLIFLFLYNVGTGIYNAMGDSKTPLYLLIGSSVGNVVLDYVFVKFFKWGVAGVAWATFIAQGISAVLCFIYIVKKFPILHLKKENFRFSLPACGKLMALGVPMALQFSITAIGTIIVQGAVNVYGEDYMAGFSAAAKIQNVICTVFVAFGATIATYVGQNWGAGKVDRVRQGVRCTQIMILAYSVIAMILVFFFSKYLTYLFISPSETKVIEVSVLYFHTVFWCYPFLGSIFLYRNTLQGLGYGLVPMLGGVFELAARSAIVVLVAGKTSFAGVCLADPAAWISALIPLIPYYIYVTRKWKKQGKIAM